MNTVAALTYRREQAGRIARAMYLVRNGKVKRLGARQFHIESGTGDGYHIDLDSDQTCYCGDREYRNFAECKHSLAARLFLADPALVAVLAEGMGYPPPDTKTS